MDIKRNDGLATPVKLWARRVWTLELSLVSEMHRSLLIGAKKDLRQQV